MKALDRIISKIFLCGLPIILILAIFNILYEQGYLKELTENFTIVHNLTGLAFALWMIFAIYLSIRLLVSETLRNMVLTKIAFIKERDEREMHLTGNATRTTFLMTLALLIFLFCLSCFQVSIYRLPGEKAINGKTGVISLGIHVNFLNKATTPKKDKAIHTQDIFTYSSLPISTTGVILLLLAWNFGWYNYLIRRTM